MAEELSPKLKEIENNVKCLKFILKKNHGSETENYNNSEDKRDNLEYYLATKFKENFIINLTKEGTKFVGGEARECCKILKFSSKCNFDEVLVKIAELVPKKYPNLFIFIIKCKNYKFQATKHATDKKDVKSRNVKNKKVEEIKAILLKFSESRPVVLQLTSKEENVTKFYYKEETSTQFFTIDQQQKNFKKVRNFPSFLCSFLNGQNEDLVEQFLETWPDVHNSSLILRFLGASNLEKDFYELLIQEVAKSGTKSFLLDVLGAPFESNGRILSTESQHLLINTFVDKRDSKTELQPVNQGDLVGEKDLLGSSVLHTAIKHKNKEIIDYLITYWTHLNQELPFEQQVEISTAAFNSNQLDVLCDLLEYSDFPFPENFTVNQVQINSKRLQKIIKDRKDFEDAISAEDFEKIEKFINQNLKLKICYYSNNESAMKQAMSSKKFTSFYYLKSAGFQATEVINLEELLTEEELKEAEEQALKQRMKNVKGAYSSINNSAILLSTRSLIHNSRTRNQEERKYRARILKWFEDINKIEFGPELLSAAASCENLKIIFDFESEMVDRVDLLSNSLGKTYAIRTSHIFIGAKLSDKSREQQIKGVLAHELCHYVMYLVYENGYLPYYRDATDIRDKFDDIVKVIDKWSSGDRDYEDDGCNGIILSLFILYTSESFHLELVVRVIHVLVEFDDNIEKLKFLRNKYRILFKFWEDYIFPELKRFNLKCRKVEKLNRYVELLPSISNQEIKLKLTKDFKDITESKLVIISTNVPKLLLIEIYSYLKKIFESLLDSKNFFTEPKKLNILQMWNDFMQICSQNSELNIFVDCSKGVPNYLGNIFINNDLNFIFIVSNEDQYEEMTKILDEKKMKVSKDVNINYQWDDLTEESQKILLQTKINFQHNSQFSLLDLLDSNGDENKPATNKIDQKCKNNDLSEIVDDQLLNFMMENLTIFVNTKLESCLEEECFKFLFQERRLIKRGYGSMSQDMFIFEVKNKQYILLSDIAGNGKSWAMKNFTKVLREKYPTRWVTYVDLKQFIEEFKAHKDELEFSLFFGEKILKPKFEFETKIFKKLYKNGKVSILFDGFDEISPDCAEFVSKLAQSFTSNGGNQLWIATRDYFEVDLQQTLHPDILCSLSVFNHEQGIDLIIMTWILMDFKNIYENGTYEQFEEYIKSSPNYRNYEEIAHKIVEKVTVARSFFIGLPQLFKMIADEFKNDKKIDFELKFLKIYENFVQKIYERWAYEKGQIRKDASIRSQSNELSFWKFHQFSAVNILFPEFVEIFFPDYDESEWSEKEIVACGLMNKSSENYIFLHETFCEFFVADFTAKMLKKFAVAGKKLTSFASSSKRKEDYVLEIFVKILTMKKFITVRIFLNDIIDDYSILKKILPEVQKSIDDFYKMEEFSVFFSRNLKNLTNFIISILKTGEYEKVKIILTKSVEDIIMDAMEPKMFTNFQEFIVGFLNSNDLKLVAKEQIIFHKIINSCHEIEIFKEFVEKIDAKIDRESIREGLSSTNESNNIFYYLCESSNLNIHKVRKFLEIILKYFTFTEVFDLMKKCSKFEQNILHVSLQVRVSKNVMIFLTEIEKFFVFHNLPQYFKKLLKQNDSRDKNVLHVTLFRDDIKIHEIMWKFLFTYFENREELENLIIKSHSFGNNFVHELIERNKNADVIKMTFKALKENFSIAHFQEILKSKPSSKVNLIQSAAKGSQNLQIYQFLWQNFRNLWKSDKEFLETFNDIDEDGQSALHSIAGMSSNEVFLFTIDELEKIASHDEILLILGKLGEYKRNILQSAVRFNRSSELHESLWKLLKKYFKSSEILKFIEHTDENGDNVFFLAVHYSLREILELTWNEIKSFLNHDEQLDYLKRKGAKDKNLIQSSLENIFNTELHEWVPRLLHDYGIKFQ